MSRVLVVSADLVGEVMAGPGIRALELARSLAGTQAVTLAVPPPVPASFDGLTVVEAVASSLRRAAAQSDVVIVQGSVLDSFPFLAGGSAALVVDLYDPFPIEGLELEAGVPGGGLRHRRDLASLVRQCEAGDYFLCASERQRLYWLGVLTACGRVNPSTRAGDPELRSLLDLVPFGVPEEPPAKGPPVVKGVVPGIGERDRVVLWGGGLWNWLDPVSLVRAAAALAADHTDLRVVFPAVQHPNPSVPRMRAAAEAVREAENLRLLGRSVFFLDAWLPYRERGRLLKEAAVGVSLHRPGLEADLAYRTRVLDYIWAGLPVLASSGDAVSEVVERDELGVVAPPGDQGAVTAGLRRLLEDHDFTSGCARRAAAAAPGLRWSQVARPLLNFCESPRHSPDRDDQKRAGGRSFLLAEAAWQSLRTEGPGGFAIRAARRLRRLR